MPLVITTTRAIFGQRAFSFEWRYSKADSTSIAHGFSGNGDAKGDLDQHNQANSVEAVEDALCDKDALEHCTDRLESYAAVESGCSIVLGTKDAVIAVTNEAGDDDGDDVDNLGAADSASAAESQRPDARRQGQANREQAH